MIRHFILFSSQRIGRAVIYVVLDRAVDERVGTNEDVGPRMCRTGSVERCHADIHKGGYVRIPSE